MKIQRVTTQKPEVIKRIHELEKGLPQRSSYFKNIFIRNSLTKAKNKR